MSDLIPRIHASGRRFVLCLTGGGSRAASSLLTTPGASQTVLEVRVPYAARALEQWLGGKPDQSCSEPTSRAIAAAAFGRARTLAPGEVADHLVGIGGTAALVSQQPRRGSHRVHIAWQSSRRTVSLSLSLNKGTRDRDGEEALAAQLVLAATAEAVGVGPPLELPLADDERLQRVEATARQEWIDLMLGRRGFVAQRSDADPAAPAWGSSEHPLVFPGAFRPLHDGHLGMAAYAAQRYGSAVWFELSLQNVDKPPLDYVELQQRLARLQDQHPYLLTSAATFVEKARLFPGAIFLVGADTIRRIADPTYYGGDPAKVTAAMEVLHRQGCRLLVFGRRSDRGFIGLKQLDLPRGVRRLCIEVPEKAFRLDISSTQLREAQS